MQLSERECEIVQEVLYYLKDCEQIKLILEADFQPEREAGEDKDALNAYGRNSLLNILIYPWAKLFFVGQLHGDIWANPNLRQDLIKFLQAHLQKMSFASGWLSSFYEKKWVDYKLESIKVSKNRVSKAYRKK